MLVWLLYIYAEETKSCVFYEKMSAFLFLDSSLLVVRILTAGPLGVNRVNRPHNNINITSS